MQKRSIRSNRIEVEVFFIFISPVMVVMIDDELMFYLE